MQIFKIINIDLNRNLYLNVKVLPNLDFKLILKKINNICNYSNNQII